MATIELPDVPPTVRQFLAMSCLGMDRLRSLFRELDVLDTHEVTEVGDLQGHSATLRSEADDIVNVIGNWETPANMGIDIDYHDLHYQIKPYEQAPKFQRSRVKEPTVETPIRRYIPKEIETILLELIDGESNWSSPSRQKPSTTSSPKGRSPTTPRRSKKPRR